MLQECCELLNSHCNGNYQHLPQTPGTLSHHACTIFQTTGNIFSGIFCVPIESSKYKQAGNLAVASGFGSSISLEDGLNFCVSETVQDLLIQTSVFCNLRWRLALLILFIIFWELYMDFIVVFYGCVAFMDCFFPPLEYCWGIGLEILKKKSTLST